MSRTKDSAVYVTGRRCWRDVSAHRRCPVCGSDSWCQVHAVDPVVLCKRTASDRCKTNADGVDFYVHNLDGATYTPAHDSVIDAVVETADEITLDAAYRAVIRSLRLTGEHWTALRSRGLSDAVIYANEYRSLTVDGRAKLGRVVVDAVGHRAAGVPGYYVARENGREWASFAGSAGIVVPARDVEGRIVALKIRRDGDGDGPRYTYVSSSRKGGASALTAVHVPRFAGTGDVVRVTEGELKADVATALTGKLTISVPGVGLWRDAIPALRRLGARRVWVAFDADAQTNERVATSLREFCFALKRERFDVRVERWDPSLGKGIDNVLALRRAG